MVGAAVARTLVISDLHLGARAAGGVLERPAPLSALLEQLDGVDRLVLLGDVVELGEGRPQAALAVALPILREIGARLRRPRTAVLVPGNHDRALVRTWIGVRGAELQVEEAVPPDASAVLSQVVTALAAGGGEVQVRYPGVWLSESVWATHGHYLDRHLIPVSTWGLIRGGRRGRLAAGVTPADYERSSRVQLSPALRWLPRPAASGVEDLADLARAATMPRLQRRVLHRGIAPVTSRLLSLQVRRHGLPALARVVDQLGIDAGWVVFGHVHRRGPLSGDLVARWRTPSGTRFLNPGSWVYEPLLVHRARPPHPYWPGGAVVLEDGREPVSIGLLDDLDAAALRPAA